MRRFRPWFASSVLGISLLAGAAAMPGVIADIVTTNIFIVAEDEVDDEDAYVAANTARIDGTINGDLIISTGSLLINGTVDGDVFVLSQGPVEVTGTGTVTGSLRGAARSVVVEGTVGDDVTVAAIGTRLSGEVGRDALVFGGSLTLDGAVERDVKGRMLTAIIDGGVGNDVDIAVSSLSLDGEADVAGDVLYRSGADATIAATAQVGSQLERLPTRGSWGVELVLTIATIVGFFGFIFAGIVLLWLFGRTAPRAVHLVLTRPLRVAAVGVGTLILLPTLVLTLLLTLVGVPVALAFMVLLALGLLFGPVPAVTAIGSKLLRSSWGLFAAFVVGAVVWRLGIWLIPLVGFALYLGALVFGLGGWVLAIWEQRKESPLAEDLLPRTSPKPSPESIPSPLGWEAPLAPGSRREAEPEPGPVITDEDTDEEVS